MAGLRAHFFLLRDGFGNIYQSIGHRVFRSRPGNRRTLSHARWHHRRRQGGVGRCAFLAWSKATLEDVSRDDGDDRADVVIGRVDSNDMAARLWRFAQLTKGFKDAIARGELDNPDVRQAIAEWENLKSEGSGRRHGRRRSETDYISYHGDIVERLFEERQARCADGERVLNSNWSTCMSAWA